MAIYYSIKEKGFYPDYIHYPNLPDDLVEISEEDYNNFFEVKEGYAQVFDEKGPRLVQMEIPG